MLDNDAMNFAPRMSKKLETLTIALPLVSKTKNESDMVHYYSPVAEDVEFNTIKIKMIDSGALDLKFEELV